MSKNTSIFSSERPDLDTKEKEKKVFERRENRKKEEAKADIYALPYLLTITGIAMTIMALFVSVSTALYTVPFYLLAVIGAYITKKSKVNMTKKIMGLRASVGTFAVGLVVVVMMML